MKTILVIILQLVITVAFAQVNKSFVVSGDSIKLNYNDFTKVDTFKIEAYIADCGEFGGHHEYIRIYQKRSHFIVTLKRDPPCQNNLDFELGIKKSFEKAKLTRNRKKIIGIFICDFNTKIQPKDYTSNAPTHFLIIYRKKIYYKEDQTGEWNKFTELSNELFKKK